MESKLRYTVFYGLKQVVYVVYKNKLVLTKQFKNSEELALIKKEVEQVIEAVLCA